MAVDLPKTRMGGALVDGGATFRIWAPRANAVYVSGNFNNWAKEEGFKLTPIGFGQWAGFVPDLKDGDQYLFFIDGQARKDFKRDPRAPELTIQPAFPESNCVLRDPSQFPWHQTGYRPPPFHKLMVYQLHVGTFFLNANARNGNFLDVALQLPYLASLGVNAIEPLPVAEAANYPTLGYNGTDPYSPENEYEEGDESALQGYFNTVNSLLLSRGQSPYQTIDVLRGSANQLRAMVDLCHVFGMAVLFDVVYGHAGGGFDPHSLWFLDLMPEGNPNDSLYFTDHAVSAGQAWAYWNNDVKQFLIDNAKAMYEEYRIDGFRFDQVSDMDANGGWKTCQDLTDTLHFLRPVGILISEYWPVDGAVLAPTETGGAGFDATWNDRLRDSVRAAIAQSAGGSGAHVNMTAIADALNFTPTSQRWQCVQFVEDHDLLWIGHAHQPRVPSLADGSDARSWYARSRSRVATAIVLTAPGIPMLFMGQEFLEDKNWSDNAQDGHNIFWDGLQAGDKAMVDHLRFTSDLLALRAQRPGFTGEGMNVFHVHDTNRVLAYHRWVPGEAHDIVVVVSLNESTYWSYELGFPIAGHWREIFNSDVYDNWVNPMVAGNGGGVEASGAPLHSLPASAAVVIPANSVVVFARE